MAVETSHDELAAVAGLVDATKPHQWLLKLGLLIPAPPAQLVDATKPHQWLLKREGQVGDLRDGRVDATKPHQWLLKPARSGLLRWRSTG